MGVSLPPFPCPGGGGQTQQKQQHLDDEETGRCDDAEGGDFGGRIGEEQKPITASEMEPEREIWRRRKEVKLRNGIEVIP